MTEGAPLHGELTEIAQARIAYAGQAEATMVSSMDGRALMRRLVNRWYPGLVPKEKVQMHHDLGISPRIPNHDEDRNRDPEKDGMEQAITTVADPHLKTQFIGLYVGRYLHRDPASIVVMLADANASELHLLGHGNVLAEGAEQPYVETWDKNCEPFINYLYSKADNPQDKWRISYAMISDGQHAPGRRRIVPEEHESEEQRTTHEARWTEREQEDFARYAGVVLNVNERSARDLLGDSRLKLIFNEMKRRERDNNGFIGDGLICDLAAGVARRVIVRDVAARTGEQVDHAIDAGILEGTEALSMLDELNRLANGVKDPKEAGEYAGEIFDRWRKDEIEKHDQVVFSAPGA